METPVITCDINDHIALVTMNNPPVNALGAAVRQGLVDGIDQALSDDAVEAVAGYLTDRDQNATDIIGRAADKVVPFSALPRRPGFWQQFAPPGAV